MTKETTITRQADSPQVLADGDEHDICLEIEITYMPDCNGEYVAKGLLSIEYRRESLALTVGGCDLELTETDRALLWQSWLAVKAHVDWLRDECIEHWNERGCQAWLDSRDERGAA